jgi:hypothetical protein
MVDISRSIENINITAPYLTFSSYALLRHNNEHSKQILTEKELRGYSPNSYIHVSVSDLCIPMIGLPILLQQNRWAERGNT